MKSESIVIGTIGIPCSGKTTLANWVSRVIPETVVVCRDDIRAELVENFSWSTYNMKSMSVTENEVTAIHKKRFVQALKDNKNVILADTWLNPKYRNDYDKIARQFGIEINWEYIHVNMYDAIERDKHRDNPVGEQAIKILHDTLLSNKDNFKIICDKFRQDMDVDRLTKLESAYIISDIDGTFTTRDTSMDNPRDWYDFDRVDEDVPNYPVAKIIAMLEKDGYDLVFATGRDGICYDKTKRNIHENLIKVGIDTPHFTLYSRKEQDRRPDWITKLEIISEIVKSRDSLPAYMFDDRQSVVDALREVFKSDVCIMQVDKGNF